MTDSSAIPFLPAVEIAAGVRSGRLRAEEVVAAFLARIARLDPRVRAIAHLDPAGALRQARAADRAVAAGLPLGPLHGVPMTVKDSFRVAGSPSSFGLPHLRHYRPAADCEAVARLRRAGAIILGRTAVPFACFDWQCRPPFRRECVNPLDPARTPGGSSGGAAAALAAGLTPLELGTDVAGSLRYPAHCCGAFALRTTVGLVPAGDSGPPGGRWPLPSLLSVGPMARSADDLALLLDAILPGPDAGEVRPRPAPRLRVAFTPAVDGVTPEPSTAAALEGFARRVGEAGHAVTTLDRPPFDFEAAYALWGLLAGYELKCALPPGLRGRLAVRAFAAWFLDYRLGTGPLAAFMRRGLLASGEEYRDGLARREELAQALDRFFDGFDMWALPVSPAPAIRRQRAGRPLPLGGERVPYSQFLGAYLCPTAVTGTPAMAGPAGAGPAGSGMPVGVQLLARRFADRWLAETVRRDLCGAFDPPHPRRLSERDA